jgi:hypothetical protein
MIKIHAVCTIVSVAVSKDSSRIVAVLALAFVVPVLRYAHYTVRYIQSILKKSDKDFGLRLTRFQALLVAGYGLVLQTKGMENFYASIFNISVILLAHIDLLTRMSMDYYLLKS